MNRALIVKKEWLDLILSGEKAVELRSKATNIRGKIGLIESGSGLIVGEVDLVDCTGPYSVNNLLKHSDEHLCTEQHLLLKWNHMWRLENAKRYKKPKPYKHPKGAVIWVKI